MTKISRRNNKDGAWGWQRDKNAYQESQKMPKAHLTLKNRVS